MKQVLVLGGGTFGLSTAYHLAKAGYKDITVLEKSAVVPPEDSAGNDLNKIIRAEYEDPFYSALALVSRQPCSSDSDLKLRRKPSNDGGILSSLRTIAKSDTFLPPLLPRKRRPRPRSSALCVPFQRILHGKARYNPS